MKSKKWTIIISIVLAALCCLPPVTLVSANDADPELQIVAYNLSFSDNVYIKYAVSAENADDVKLLIWTEPQAEYTYENKEDEISPSYKDTVSGKECFIFDYTKFAAKQMGDVVYARAYTKKGGVETYSSVKKYSILQYALNKLGKTGTATQDEDLRDLLEGMLEYGALAQKYFGYKTDRLVTSEFYSVSVTGGELPDGFTEGLFLKGEKVTLSAKMYNSDNQQFDRWEDSSGDSVGVSLINEITVGEKNEKYEAVYKDYSVGLEFESNDDETCCLLGMGDFSGTDLIIPRYSPDGDLVTEIDRSAFAGEGIISVSIPMTINSIGSGAFKNCASLTDVYFEGTAEEWETFVDEAVGANNAPLTGATIHTAEPTTYTVTFVDWDGTELKKETVKEGGSATAPDDPKREGYTFKGWDVAFDNVIGDLVVTAQYAIPYIEVSKTKASSGDSDVEVTVSLKNNPGISSLILTVAYDSGVTLTDVVYNTSIGGVPLPPQSTNSPFILYWVNGLADSTGDWTFATLKFAVSDHAVPGTYNISVSYNADDVYDISETNIYFSVIDGSIIVE